jgi:hypothetical protein
MLVKFVFVDDDDDVRLRWFCLLFIEWNGDDGIVWVRYGDFFIGVNVDEQEDKWRSWFRLWQQQQ